MHGRSGVRGLAGQPKRRAVVAELIRRGREELGEDLSEDELVLGYLEMWQASGQTLTDLAAELEAQLQVGKIFREVLSKIAIAIQERLGEGAEGTLARARARGAHALAEGARTRILATPAQREMLQRAKMVGDIDLWLAERWNPAELAQQKGTNITISLPGMHLESLRSIAAGGATMSALPSPAAEAEVVSIEPSS